MEASLSTVLATDMEAGLYFCLLYSDLSGINTYRRVRFGRVMVKAEYIIMKRAKFLVLSEITEEN
jgi:hypothetical protein